VRAELSPAPLQLRLYSQIDQVDVQSWEMLRQVENPLTDRDYLRAVEESKVFDFQPQYFQFFREESAIAAVAGYVLYNDIALYSGIGFQNQFQKIRNRNPNFLKIKTLEIGTPIGLGFPFSISPSATLPDLESIISQLIRFAQVEKISLILIRDFQGENNLLEEALLKKNLIQLKNFPIACMPIRWKTFDEYLSQLKIGHRKQIRRKIRQKEKLGIQTVITNDSSALQWTKEYVALFDNVYQQAKEYAREFMGEDYHVAMQRNLGDKSYWIHYFYEDRLVAFSQILIYGNRLLCQVIGMDYQVSLEAALYFNAYYDVIRFAIDHSLGFIDAGVSTYGPKSAIGFSVYPQRMYLWHSNPIARKIMGWGFKNIGDYDLKEIQYAFVGDQFQYLWDGQSYY